MPQHSTGNSLGPAATPDQTATLSFVIPPAPACRGSEADLSRRAVEGSAVPRASHGNVYRQSGETFPKTQTKAKETL